MKTILNRTQKPLRVHLHGNKVLHLGPGHSGQIGDDSAEEPSVRKLVEAGEIEVLGAESEHVSAPGTGPARESRGHAPENRAVVKGNRGG